MKATVTLIATLTLLLLVAGCAGGEPSRAPEQPLPAATDGPGEVAAMVNGRAIAYDLFEAQLQAAVASFAQPGLDANAADVQAALRAQVLELLIDQSLVDQAAERMGIVVDDAQVAAEVEHIRGQAAGSFSDWLQANGYTEETFRAQVRSDLLGAAVRDRVTQGVAARAEQVHLRQILVAEEAQARALADQLRESPSGFEALAREHSLDESSRDSGGDLGYLPRGILPPSVEEVAFALEPGEVSEPVPSHLGWHILRLEARDPARDIPPEMLGALRHQAFLQWLDEERAGAAIERFIE